MVAKLWIKALVCERGNMYHKYAEWLLKHQFEYDDFKIIIYLVFLIM